MANYKLSLAHVNVHTMETNIQAEDSLSGIYVEILNSQKQLTNVNLNIK